MKTQLAVNSEIYSPVELSDGKAPEWVELIPAGPTVVGRDGRTWLFDDVAHQFVQTNFSSRAIDLPIDWEHATQRRAPLGQEAPAGAWIKQLEIRDGALWGLAEWTPRGELQVENKEYRFLSPVFDYDDETKRIVRMVSAALTNIPNLVMTALNQEQLENVPVKPSPELLKLLGLPETATAEQVFTATTAKLNATNQALNSESGNLERFVPRADYNALESRAMNAEQALAEHKKTEHAKAVDAVITAATQAGKITPATVDYHRAMCQDEAGLTRFKAFVDAAPVVADPTDLGGRKPENIATALNSEEQAMCKLLGVDPVDFAKTKQSEV
ncbi:phage protease [Pseudomonas sp. MAFF 311095]|uniref:phage protease n=1 Tax=Pseudomonas petroselini TaxID=2899822 RepID=UPI001E471382|nr:phage protease [Pseudomonas petroselini]MCD7046670.1 phage protease [Pseudomonas petroselini]MCD7068835.1 phage protease [Pseudomonas petroselini]MCD7079218.1 phage protease [Pseudomonas petroselini]